VTIAATVGPNVPATINRGVSAPERTIGRKKDQANAYASVKKKVSG